MQETDPKSVPALLSRETKIELERKGNRAVQEADLIQPTKKLGGLATLHSSLVSLCSFQPGRFTFC